MSRDKHHRLPSRELAYHYTVAMHFAQILELNLRALLYTAHYHGWGGDLDLTQEQRRRFKDTNAFIDDATCGAIIDAIRKKKLIAKENLIQVFHRACNHRNRLAHAFLSNHDFDNWSPQQEKSAIADIIRMTEDLYKAARFSRALRSSAEDEADKHTERLAQTLVEVLPNYQDLHAKYATRAPQKKKK